MHIPVLGLIDKSPSVINTDSLALLYSVGMLGSIFDICWKKKKDGRTGFTNDFLSSDFMIVDLLSLYFHHNQIGYVIYILILRKQCTTPYIYTIHFSFIFCINVLL